MKTFMFIVLTGLAAACTTQSASDIERPDRTCVPRDGTCDADPRLPAARATLAQDGIDLERDLDQLTLRDGFESDDGVAIADKDSSSLTAVTGHECNYTDATKEHGSCCFYVVNSYFAGGSCNFW